MRRFLLLALVLAVAFSVAACGGISNSPVSSSTSSAPSVSSGAAATPPSGPTVSDNTGSDIVNLKDGEWPIHEYTADIPQPALTVGAVNEDVLGLEIQFTDASYDDIKAFVTSLQAAGFNQNENTIIDNGTALIWNANNAKWGVNINGRDDGTASLLITKL